MVEIFPIQEIRIRVRVPKFQIRSLLHNSNCPSSFFRDLEGRYAVAAETRNNLVAASQNISGAQRYLANVQFPYCAPPEVETLNKVSFLHAFHVQGWTKKCVVDT